MPILCRFWQRKLTTDCPFWVNNGIVPWLGRPAGQSWQELAIMAAQLQMAEEQNHALQYPLSDEARKAQLWTAAAGKRASAMHLADQSQQLRGLRTSSSHTTRLGYASVVDCACVTMDCLRDQASSNGIQHDACMFKSSHGDLLVQAMRSYFCI